MRDNLAIPLSSLGILGMVALIQAVVADSYGIARSHMTSGARDRSAAWPRQVAMYLARELTVHSLSNIGRMFGGRDHTTVIYAISQVKKRVAFDPIYSGDVEALRAALLADCGKPAR